MNKTNIPPFYQTYCKNPNLKLEECPYYICVDCPNTCYLARRLSKGIIHSAETGLQRFYKKYPNWNKTEKIGIGAMVKEDLRRLK